MLSPLRVVLLAAVAVAIAQAAFILPSREAVVLVTSSKAHVPGVDAHPRSDAEVLEGDAVAESAPTSVVQDWSLVCQQLCGAGLGGDPCAPYCTDLDLPTPEEQAANADAILDPNRQQVCEDLCRLELGEVNCLCEDEAETTVEPIEEPAVESRVFQSRFFKSRTTVTVTEMNEVCGTFCTNNGATLTGCTLCTFDEAIASDTTTASTTPDWDELCVSLCKTGDGGSLCNCDLSPFF